MFQAKFQLTYPIKATIASIYKQIIVTQNKKRMQMK